MRRDGCLQLLEGDRESARQAAAKVGPTNTLELAALGRRLKNMDDEGRLYEKRWIGCLEQTRVPVWILSPYSEFDFGCGPTRRSDIGELVYKSKYCRSLPHLKLLQDEMDKSAVNISGFPPSRGLGPVTCVAAVPYFRCKSLSLPHKLAARVAEALEVPDRSEHLKKIGETPEAKTSRNGLRPDVYEVSPSLRGQSLLLVDDVIHTGETLRSVAVKLQKAGCKNVVAICATSTTTGLRL